MNKTICDKFFVGKRKKNSHLKREMNFGKIIKNKKDEHY